jgi:hypothetical protein
MGFPDDGLTVSSDKQADAIRKRLRSQLESGDTYSITLDLADILNGVAEQAAAAPDPLALLEESYNLLVSQSRIVPLHYRALPAVLTSIRSTFRRFNLSPEAHLDLLWRMRESSPHALARAVVDMELSLLFTKLNRDDAAAQRLAVAKRIIDGEDDEDLQAFLDISIAATSVMLNDLETAQAALDRCLSRHIEPRERARALAVRGAHHALLRDDTAAMADFLESERLFRSIDNTFFAAVVTTKRCFLLVVQNREDEAYAELTRLLSELTSQKEDDRSDYAILEIRLLLARLASATGLFTESLSHCRVLGDTLNGLSHIELADLVGRMVADRPEALAELVHLRMMANLTSYECYLVLADRKVSVPTGEMSSLANAIVEDLEFLGESESRNAVAALEAFELPVSGIPLPPESTLLRLRVLIAARDPISGSGLKIEEKLSELGSLIRAEQYSEAKSVVDGLLANSGESHPNEPTSSVWRAMLLGHRCTIEFYLGNLREALDAGLTSLALSVTRRSGLRFEDMRNSTLTLAGTTRYALLFQVAHELLPHSLAELIETIRGQATPIRHPTSWPIAVGTEQELSQTLHAVDNALTHLPVTDLSFVSVDGVSTLAGHGTGNVSVNDFSIVIGNRSHRAWLGYRRVADDFYGAIVTACGTRRAFRLVGGEVDKAIRDLSVQLPTPLLLHGRIETSAEALERAFKGALSRPDSERKLMELLGTVLMPPDIWTIIQGEGIQELLVAPDPDLRSVPWALLRSPEGRPLAFYAGPALVPPISVCADLASHSEVSQAEVPLKALIVGNDADLYWARRLSDPLETNGAAPHANEMTQYLPDSPGESGVIVFACHVARSVGLASGSARLQLSGGSSLSASQLLVGSLPSWARVLLAGCSSSGVTQGAAEWWGLPVAFLYGGARSVVSTVWDLPDAHETMMCDADVAQRLTRSDPPSATLRSFVMDRLMDWQVDPSRPSPVFFASYCLVTH